MISQEIKIKMIINSKLTPSITVSPDEIEFRRKYLKISIYIWKSQYETK